MILFASIWSIRFISAVTSSAKNVQGADIFNVHHDFSTNCHAKIVFVQVDGSGIHVVGENCGVGGDNLLLVTKGVALPISSGIAILSGG